MSKSEYKDVQIGPKTASIPENWEVKPLEDIFDLYAGGDIEDSQYSETMDEAHPYPIYANSTEDSGLYGYCSDFEYPEGSVTITGRGDLGYAVYRNNKFNAAVRLVVLTPSEDLDGQFFAYYINGKVDFPPESTGVPQLTRPQVAKTKVCVPPLPEQRRIADILSTIDKQVRQIDEAIEKARELRRGLMQELLLRGIDHEEFQKRRLGLSEVSIPESWSVQNAGSLFNLKKTGFDPSDHTGEVYLYSMPAFDEGEEPVVTPAEEIGSKKRIVPEDTILFPKLNIRKKRFWRVRHDHNLPAICSTEYWPLTETEDAHLDFYTFYFESYQFMSDPKVSSSSSTNSHKRVTQSSFKKVQLPVPPIEEQRQIADILKTASEKIEQEYKQKKNLQEVKRGLMQDLLTGNIRVDAD